MRYGGFDLDATIQSSKDFRNPSIYEKLISHVGIDEKATNYPPVSQSCLLSLICIVFHSFIWVIVELNTITGII